MLAACAVTAPAPAAGERIGPPPQAELSRDLLASRIDGFFNAEVAAGKIPGAIVEIRHRGETVYAKSFGLQDVDHGKPMRDDAIFELHSVTKTITSVAVMMLVDDGKLKLIDPVGKYIPAFDRMFVGVESKADNGNRQLNLVPAKRPITIEDLLLHTSGITYGFYGGDSMVKWLYSAMYFGDYDNEEFADRIAHAVLADQPGTLWNYGHSYDVLGRVIEVVSGQSLYAFEKQRLLDPLGMTDTKFFLTDPAERARYAQRLPKDRREERNALEPTRWQSGGGGMVSTRRDLSRFVQMLENGGEFEGRRYLSPSAFKAMTSDHIGPETGIKRNEHYYPGDGFGYGYGYAVRTSAGDKRPPDPGSLGEIKWDGASGVYFVIDRAQQLTILLMENLGPDHVRIQQALKRIVYDAFEQK
ncbi:serine hydrolase domain-containing protein [Rhodopseudomonas sp. NSM]|uniref:serine hydrolase domain-containing protein n=1 Tax=Rhodopseudomonas sp. NSM TaxID=3457630 RepID=UPI0040368F47